MGTTPIFPCQIPFWLGRKRRRKENRSHISQHKSIARQKEGQTQLREEGKDKIQKRVEKHTRLAFGGQAPFDQKHRWLAAPKKYVGAQAEARVCISRTEKKRI